MLRPSYRYSSIKYNILTLFNDLQAKQVIKVPFFKCIYIFIKWQIKFFELKKTKISFLFNININELKIKFN